ncbi:hypothetical protein B0T26DRAFT_679759 [Lasiosphaeria miniovina]|uniref:Uncharacterized protein n=1 Tax=Lasiosphaeria miniovina TaxID=1954250 RepID=A0AA40DN73_9PEZI|nr:uncharacterized protein B0T26DRAFT_679759 [Lasiosphaeria miniovina]KAK0706023.1 hypothetical protein B0T26DRAFT_679759 [Lasiosphaeria miniovina]
MRFSHIVTGLAASSLGVAQTLPSGDSVTVITSTYTPSSTATFSSAVSGITGGPVTPSTTVTSGTSTVTSTAMPSVVSSGGDHHLAALGEPMAGLVVFCVLSLMML